MNNAGGLPDSCGPTDIPEIEPVLQAAFGLGQNYPNPFNSSTRIKFSLPKREHLQLTIYDILGREVRTLIDDDRPAGNYDIFWDGRNNDGDDIASGVYLYQIRTSDFASTRKLLLIK
jgi:hypothetical protein